MPSPWADIAYERLYDMDDMNSDLPQTDVALIIGANAEAEVG